MKRANLLVNGLWQKGYDTSALVLPGIRQWVRPEKTASFPAEKGRYHLYVSPACPWTHRAVLVRHLKGLGKTISMSSVATVKQDESWLFCKERPDPLHPKFTHMHQVYTCHDPEITTRVSVPVLWDKKTNQIVSTESADIMLMFNSAFNEFAKKPEFDFYPPELQDPIEAMNERTFLINAGVYRCAMAGSEALLAGAKSQLFAALDGIESHLDQNKYLVGDRLTTADLRLFPTLIRFDQIYNPFFKCDQKKIADYPALKSYLENLCQIKGFLDTVDWQENMDHYYSSFPNLDPTIRPAQAIPEHIRRLSRPGTLPSAVLHQTKTGPGSPKASGLTEEPSL